MHRTQGQHTFKKENWVICGLFSGCFHPIKESISEVLQGESESDWSFQGKFEAVFLPKICLSTPLCCGMIFGEENINLQLVGIALKQTAIAQKHNYSGTTIQLSAKGLAKYVHLNKVLLYRGSFPYILL